MPIRRNPEFIIAKLMERISKAKCPLHQLDSNSNGKLLNEQFKKIEQGLQDMKEIFPTVKYWEELVIGEFDSLEQDIADERFAAYTHSEIEVKFQSMIQKIGKIQSMNSSIKLNSVIKKKATKAPEAEQLMSEDWKMSKDWQLLSIEKSILESSAMGDLQVSYDKLERHLKLCFLCFAIFPKNAVIKKRPLIYWWIGEGLVTFTNDKTAEQVGEGILEELQKTGMIKPVHKNKVPTVSSYTMHPWIQRMVISVAKRAGFFDFDDNGKLTADFPISRRACFVSPNGGLENASTSKLEELIRAGLVSPTRRPTDNGNSRQEELHQSKKKSSRGGGNGSGSKGSGSRQDEPLTLFNVNKKYLDIEHDWFSKQTKLVVLQLGRWQNSATHHIEVESTKFLNCLGAQKNLRYLSFRGISRITELPESISGLTTLKILDLRACHNLEKLPAGIKSMRKLTHLDVSECYLLEQMPKGLEALSELQVLKGFVIGNSISKDPCGLKDLTKLKKLRKLSLIVGSDAVVAEEELGELKLFEKLCILTITWGADLNNTAQEATAKILKRAATKTMSSLSMPKNLEKLDLRCFPKKDSPIWLRADELTNLKRLYIRGGKLGRLGINANETWNVKVLRLKFLRNLVVEWAALQVSFPNLDYLETKKCDKLQSFQCDEHGVWVKHKVTV